MGVLISVECEPHALTRTTTHKDGGFAKKISPKLNIIATFEISNVCSIAR